MEDDWAKLSKAERIERCRTEARNAETYAEIAGSEMRDIYKRLAAQWHMVAAEIEREKGDGPAG